MNRLKKSRRGATMVFMAIMLPVLFVMSAMVINLAYMQAINTKVQVVTDASVRAAGAAYVETADEAAGLAAAQQMASLNPIETIVLPISSSDLEFGLSERNTKGKAYTFTASPGTNGNSVRLTTSSFAAGAGTALHPFFSIGGTNIEIRPTCRATYSQTTLDVAVVVDRSGSMKYAANEDSHSGNPPAAAPAGWSNGDAVPPQSRWLDVVAAVNGFCNELTQTTKLEKVSLCSYSDSSRIDETLTDDYQKIDDELDHISAKFEGGMTAVGDGILDGISSVADPKHARPWATNAIVLMSDGMHNTGTDPIVAAGYAVDESIPIYTVSFSSEADQALMQQIADMTGGTHYHAVDAAQLNAAFREIARRLPSMLTE